MARPLDVQVNGGWGRCTEYNRRMNLSVKYNAVGEVKRVSFSVCTEHSERVSFRAPKLIAAKTSKER